MTSKRNSNPYKKYCCVYGCMNKTNKELQLTFYNVPKDPERRREWLKIIDREDLLDEKKKKVKYNYVCSAHFDDSAFVTTIFKRLINDAVPTKQLPQKSTETSPQASKSRSANKGKATVPTYSHSECQTEPQEEVLYEVNEEPVTKPNIVFMNIEPDIAKPNVNTHNKSSNKNQTQKSSPTERTTCTTQSQTKLACNENNKPKQSKAVSTETQTDTNKASNFAHSIKITHVKSLSDNAPVKRKRKEEIEFVDCKRRRADEDVSKIHDELESKNVSLLPDTDEELAQKIRKLNEWQNKIRSKISGNQYDAEYKLFALNLHYASPQTYHYIQTVLKLPNQKTLNKFKFEIPPILDDRVLESLSLKIKSLPSNAKYCTICVGEMALKRNLYYDIKKDEVIGFHNINGTISPEIASKAYVIMLQGICYNWKQPIAYALLGSTTHYAALDSWMNKVILKLFGIGVEVKAVISVHGSYFDKYANEIKNVTIDKPYFYLKEHKIFYIFDVPNLLKSVRNNLLSNDYHFKEDKISWDYIKLLYELQKHKNSRLIPKITDAHVEPNNFQKNNIKYATQVFSNTVSAALDTYIDFGKITAEAKGTAKFIKIMNDLYDVLNSSKMKGIKSAFKMSIDQKSILQHAQHMFATIKSTNRKTGEYNTNQNKTFKNFQITIQSVLQLSEELKSEGFDYLFTRCLNQDSLDSFFESVKQQYGWCSEPTPIQFTRAFSKLFYDYMLKDNQTNCESDIYEMLYKAEDIVNKVTKSPPDPGRPSLVALGGETDYRMVLPKNNALTYVAGFLLFKCSQKHPNCKKLHAKLDSSVNLDQIKFTNCNKNKSFHSKLKMPSKTIMDYIVQLETAFTRNFEHQLRGRPGSEIFKILQKIQIPTLPCLCFPVDYLLRLFVRLRIFVTLKSNNWNLKLGKKAMKQYFKVKPLEF